MKATEPKCPKCTAPGMSMLSEMSYGKNRWYCTNCTHRTVNPDWGDPQQHFMKELPEGGKYVFVGAQNATPIFKAFLKTLLIFCDHRGYQLIVLPYRYHNPTSPLKRRQRSMCWL